ncbi:MAG: hypothetical protein LBG90_08200 [Spirochaetaceae bacterium]|jgi:hypothetical protein|nr:hypothetical protein [Spirochaetaceae bacterium]
MPGKVFPPALIPAAVLSIAACGIEDYPFLDKVPTGNISVTLNQMAVITLPRIDSIYFTHFTLYYRIYMSGVFYPEIHPGNMSDLNSALMADYNYFLPYTNSDTSNTTVSIGSLFTNRKYYPLTLEGADIDGVLGSGSFGKSMVLNFTETTPRIIPNLSINGNSYNMRRFSGNGLFSPVPANRYFINTPELNAPANITAGINADVIDKSDITTRYAYAGVYIVVTGVDGNFSPLYSVPTFIGVFYLPGP